MATISYQDASIMEAFLNVMGFERYHNAAEWLMTTLPRPPTLCYNCREYRKRWFVEERKKGSLHSVPDVWYVHIAEIV